MHRLSASCLPLMMFLMLPGCGGQNRGQVAGNVTLDGKAVENGVITFVPRGETRGPSTSTTIKEGRYSLGYTDGPIVGTNRVEILAYRKTGKKVRDITGGGMIDEIVQAAPAVYNVESNLDRTIKSGSNSLDFDIATKR